MGEVLLGAVLGAIATHILDRVFGNAHFAWDYEVPSKGASWVEDLLGYRKNTNNQWVHPKRQPWANVKQVREPLLKAELGKGNRHVRTPVLRRKIYYWGLAEDSRVEKIYFVEPDVRV